MDINFCYMSALAVSKICSNLNNSLCNDYHYLKKYKSVSEFVDIAINIFNLNRLSYFELTGNSCCLGNENSYSVQLF